MRRDEALPAADTDVHPLLRDHHLPRARSSSRTPDHVAFAYRADYDEAIVPSPIGTLSHPGYATLEFGAFRRGGDGRWRRLTGAIPLTGRRDGRRLWSGHPAPVNAAAYGSRRCNAGRAAPAT